MGGRAFSSGPRRVAVAALGALAAALAGCGAGTPAATTDSATTRPTSTAATTSTVPASIRAQEQALHAQVTAALQGAKRNRARYGGRPTFLPRVSTPVGRLLSADPRHPAVAIEGDTIRLRTGTASALATAVGPQVPPRVAGSGVPVTPARFIVTFAQRRGRLPLAAADFTIIDEQGHLHRPRAQIAPGTGGGPLTVVLTDELPIGSGDLRFAPAGGVPLVSWEFAVETD